MTTSRVNLKLIIIVLVVYAVREAHSTKQGFFSGSEKVSLNREPVFLVSLGLSNRLLRESSGRLRCDSAIARETESDVEVS